MTTTKLTKTIISNELICPPGRARIEICDAETRGLYVEVRATSPGQGTYYFRYKNEAGKTCHQKIGRTTDIPLADAKTRAKTLRAEIALGADPRGEAKSRKATITLSAFFDNHYLPHAKVHKRSWRRDKELFELRIREPLGGLRLTDLTRHRIQLLHTGILEEGLAPATADHHVKLLRHALNLAVDWEMLDKNPSAGVPLFNRDNRIERYMSDVELDRLLQVLRSDPNRSVCQIAMFLLSTGCRLNEALRATWDQVDETNRVWRIPAANSKSKKVRSIPLNDSALEMLNEAGPKVGGGTIFANRKTGKAYTSIMKVWSRLRAKANLQHVRLHDLRHQYASFLVNNGRSLYEVQQILGHSSPVVTQRYAHLSTKSLQDAAASASAAIRNATGVQA